MAPLRSEHTQFPLAMGVAASSFYTFAKLWLTKLWRTVDFPSRILLALINFDANYMFCMSGSKC